MGKGDKDAVSEVCFGTRSIEDAVSRRPAASYGLPQESRPRNSGTRATSAEIERSSP